MDHSRWDFEGLIDESMIIDNNRCQFTESSGVNPINFCESWPTKKRTLTTGVIAWADSSRHASFYMNLFTLPETNIAPENGWLKY